jgi:hypothetical protein
MNITICGHAGVMVDSMGTHVLVDPIVRSTPLGIGSTIYSPGRRLERERLPHLDAIVVTHAHFDHYDLESLSQFDRKTPVIVPRDARIHRGLADLGFRTITLGPWETHRVGALALRATPSTAPVVEDEFGLLFDDGKARFWHMSDAEVSTEVSRRILAEGGPVDVISTKYQPQARAHLHTMFCLGADLDKEELASWLESACACSPKFAFPYAAGVVLDGRDRWMNHYIFPFSTDEVAELLSARLKGKGVGATVLPGDVITVGEDGNVQHHRGAASAVVHDPEVEVDCTWEPIDVSHLRVLERKEERGLLADRLFAMLGGGFGRWLARCLRQRSPEIAPFVDYKVAWQLVVHAGPEQRIEYGIDFGAPTIELVEGRLPRANYFVHVSGAGLLRALTTSRQEMRNLFTCAEIRVFEKIFAVRDGQFWWPPNSGRKLLSESLPEPLASYLALVHESEQRAAGAAA